MRRTPHVAALLIFALISTARPVAAQPTPGPTIRSVTLDEAGDLLTITGAGFGPVPEVTIDGQPVTVLPGGSDTQVTVQTPAVLQTTAGTYRLTVSDTTRHKGETFVVATRGGLAGISLAAGASSIGATGADQGVAAPSSQGGATATVVSGTSGVVGGATIDTVNNTAFGSGALASNTTGYGNAAFGVGALQSANSYYNTATGAYSLYSDSRGGSSTANGGFALYSNTTGGGNTAQGYGALYSNSTGSNNTAVGYDAGYYALGSYNIMIGSTVYGVAGDTNTTRIGLPYSSGSGQNRTFIAGIRGTAVSGGAPVVIDANGQMGTAPATGFAFTDSGRVGIGTAAPETKLELLTGTNDGLMVKDGITQGILYTSSLLGHSLAFGTQSDHPILFGTNNSFDRLTIAANGNVGVGTTAPAAKLEVKNGLNDGLRITDGTLNGILFASGYLGRSFAFGTQSNHAFIFGTNNTWGRLTIAADGNIGIGTMTPGQPLEMASGAYVSAGGVWTNASSRSLKEQILDLSASRALDAFARLQPVTFAYKAEPTQMHVGFIAEDVPELVATNDRKSLSAMDLVAVVTKVVQIQQSQLAEERQQRTDERQQLEATIAALTERLSRLEAGGRSQPDAGPK